MTDYNSSCIVDLTGDIDDDDNEEPVFIDELVSARNSNTSTRFRVPRPKRSNVDVIDVEALHESLAKSPLNIPPSAIGALPSLGLLCGRDGGLLHWPLYTDSSTPVVPPSSAGPGLGFTGTDGYYLPSVALGGIVNTAVRPYMPPYGMMIYIIIILMS